jgi:wyosine [tRNA(Phe)-imidazoG37] synthetase (radical SAM superfamily)
MLMRRRRFYKPEKILTEVERKVEELRLKGERIDYLTFVPDGEPTLDANLGREILLLRRIGIPIAVITNASLLWKHDIRESLLEADLISLKIDAASQDLWEKVNRPHKSLQLNDILRGIKEFTEIFDGTIISETMLIDGINYGEELKRIADYLGKLDKLDAAYIAVPTRPPAEGWVKPARGGILNEAFQAFSRELGGERVKFLVKHGEGTFAFTRGIEDEIVSIAAVHPIRKDDLTKFLSGIGVDPCIIEKLVQEGKLIKLRYGEDEFYRRRF